MKKATAFAGSPEEKEKPGATGHRAQDESTKQNTHTLTGKKKEVREAKAVVIQWSEDPRTRAKQFGEWGRVALLLTHEDKVAMRGAWAIDKLFMLKNGWMGWSAPDIADWLEVSLSTIEDGLSRVSRMGLLVNADIQERGPDGRFVTTMSKWLLALPADYSGAKPIASSKKTTRSQTSDVLGEKTRRSVRRTQNAPVPDPERLGSKTSQENASNQTFERKQTASQDSESNFSVDELALIENEAKSDSEIDELILEEKLESRTHFLNATRARLSKKFGIEKGGPRWQLLYAAIDRACSHKTAEEEKQAVERTLEREKDEAEKSVSIERHFENWATRWQDPGLQICMVVAWSRRVARKN